jgi:phage repressor protein C with HTH and peptisase S24 domain
MKRLSLCGLGLLSVFVLSACETEYEEVEVRERERGGFRPPSEEREVRQPSTSSSSRRETTSATTTTEVEEVAPSTATSSTTTEVTEAPVTTTPPPAPAGNYEYGKQVPGKPGFVTSPHSPYSGYVDVRGFPPGTEVKDPYTGKIFLVP